MPDAGTVFHYELTAISDRRFRDFAVACLEAAPPEFWRFSASTSRYYHPRFARAGGGLILHTQAAVRVALDLLEAFPELASEQDAIIVALLLHDTCKVDPETGRTRADHPLLPRKRYGHLAGMLPAGEFERVMDLVDTHMGIWGPADTSRMVSPVPSSLNAAVLVHLADYVASRQWVSPDILETGSLAVVVGELYQRKSHRKFWRLASRSGSNFPEKEGNALDQR